MSVGFRVAAAVAANLYLVNVGINAIALLKTWRLWRRQQAQARRVLQDPDYSPEGEDKQLLTQMLRSQVLKLMNEVHTLQSKAPSTNDLTSACNSQDENSSSTSTNDDASSADRTGCPVCWADDRAIAFGCGHVTCDTCSTLCDACPVCREQVKTRLRLYL